jgi:hypothetical protein
MALEPIILLFLLAANGYGDQTDHRSDQGGPTGIFEVTKIFT